MNKLLKYLLFGIVLLSSCASHKEMVYLQDAGMDMTAKINNYEGVKIQKDDVLSIVVYSKTSELVEPFNLATIVPVSIGGIHLIAKQPNTSGYTVDKNGEIDFPVFGKLRVEGLTREELSTFIKNKLIAENFVNDPIVMVRFLSFKIFVAGEVAKPGMYEITYDRITILEALAMAGDLTANGKRNNIKIIREKNGERKIYIVDLRTAELFNSPAYYLQQNDYIYVEPNNHKIKNANRK